MLRTPLRIKAMMLATAPAKKTAEDNLFKSCPRQLAAGRGERI
jgi:hypothetical protein